MKMQVDEKSSRFWLRQFQIAMVFLAVFMGITAYMASHPPMQAAEFHFQLYALTKSGEEPVPMKALTSLPGVAMCQPTSGGMRLEVRQGGRTWTFCTNVILQPPVEYAPPAGAINSPTAEPLQGI